ncbi:MAG: outer membrane protein assembly factor [Myxococcales bacterium]|nr:outer membrane protein assembly factor [Myxococcales bacterium]
MALIAGLVSPARAQEKPDANAAAESTSEPGAQETEAAHARVRSTDARPLARPDQRPTLDLRLVPRVLLGIPRLVLRVSTGALIQGSKFERDHRLRQRAESLFFDERRIFGVFPTAFVETGFTPSIGARLVHRDLFGEREHLLMRAGYAGVGRQIYELGIDSGQALGGGQLSLEAGYEVHDSRPFYGVGNADRLQTAPSLPMDALDPESAESSIYRSEEVHIEGKALSRLGGGFQLQLKQLLRHRELSEGGNLAEPDRAWITARYDPNTLTGFGAPLRDSYNELALSYSHLERSRPFLPLPSSGIRARVWGGFQAEFLRPHSSFGRVGFELQPFFDLYRGDRVLLLRLRSSAVIGELHTIPFVDLPQLGGSLLLRGYRRDRFRGRITALGSAEYRYPVQERLSAYLFVDAGRAYRDLQDLGFSDLRLGYGAGLHWMGHTGARFRLQLASSIDGGLFFHMRLNPSDDPSDTH